MILFVLLLQGVWMCVALIYFHIASINRNKDATNNKTLFLIPWHRWTCQNNTPLLYHMLFTNLMEGSNEASKQCSIVHWHCHELDIHLVKVACLFIWPWQSDGWDDLQPHHLLSTQSKYSHWNNIMDLIPACLEQCNLQQNRYNRLLFFSCHFFGERLVRAVHPASFGYWPRGQCCGVNSLPSVVFRFHLVSLNSY